jgi:hypothetical protein
MVAYSANEILGHDRAGISQLDHNPHKVINFGYRLRPDIGPANQFQAGGSIIAVQASDLRPRRREGYTV